MPTTDADPFRFTSIAHRDHSILSPVSTAKLDELIGRIPLSAADEVLDIGCGKGAVVIRIAEAKQVRCVGVDLNRSFLETATQAAEVRGLSGQVQFQLIDAKQYQVAAHRFRLIVSCGASQAIGGYEEVVSYAYGKVPPEGYLLVGQTYWRQPPSTEYLEFLGMDEEDERTHAENLEVATRAGWIHVYSTTADCDDWDRYEGMYSRAVETFVEEHPGDRDSQSFLERIRSWRNAYLKWGRDALGFGLYLFKRPIS